MSYTCCAQPARRERREDSAGSGDADEDEGAEAPGGLLGLEVEMYVFLWWGACNFVDTVSIWLRQGREHRRVM